MARQSLTELSQHGAFARMMDLIQRRQQRVDDLQYRLAHAERGVLERLPAAVRHTGRRRCGITTYAGF